MFMFRELYGCPNYVRMPRAFLGADVVPGLDVTEGDLMNFVVTRVNSHQGVKGHTCPGCCTVHLLFCLLTCLADYPRAYTSPFWFLTVDYH